MCPKQALVVDTCDVETRAGVAAQIVQKASHVSNPLIHMCDILTRFCVLHNLGMEPNDAPTAHPTTPLHTIGNEI